MLDRSKRTASISTSSLVSGSTTVGWFSCTIGRPEAFNVIFPSFRAFASVEESAPQRSVSIRLKASTETTCGSASVSSAAMKASSRSFFTTGHMCRSRRTPLSRLMDRWEDTTSGRSTPVSPASSPSSSSGSGSISSSPSPSCSRSKLMRTAAVAALAMRICEGVVKNSRNSGTETHPEPSPNLRAIICMSAFVSTSVTV
mmetsp:Transcript_1720/g.3734  ORF Transcript_1720/g.3734 Transcript_1720/m.3734 type:complete len:200 (-) Transcript_1720:219-818(-)